MWPPPRVRANKAMDAGHKCRLSSTAMRHLPPLAAVRVFEAAARHQNFTVAASELGMTQAAVSYQVKLLEERLGVALFRRERRRVLLTEAGARAAAQLTRAFDAIDAAFAGLRAEDEAVLTISCTNTFASTWLAWQLGGFQLAYPAMAVRLLTSDKLADFASDEVDVGIRSGTGDWPGLVRHWLLTMDFTPMCSPAFLAAHGGTLAPADLTHLPLISAHDSWWTIWLREAGVAVADDGRDRPGVRLDSQAHEGHAAMAGQGVALLTPFFWQNDLAAGRLVRPFDQVSGDGHGYWLVYPEGRARVAKIRRFRDWLLPTLTADGAS
jgi:LysR family transcriptional regulator, glycine cleavage system transcriptional activator